MQKLRSCAGLLGSLVLLSTMGCAAARPRPVETDAALGKVVVYRNGVAYFERYAHVRGDKLHLSVPGERLDDLLKSLTIVDARSGKPIPVSFPTLEQDGDIAELVIELPKPAPQELRISYVTESPAWKPSYRLKLSEKGPARLEAWAVVDNVSGEDWEKVAVGVGSTSALSFRFDLHSVRYVQRETLTDGTLLGAAPPTGGSPYAVAGKELQVLANVSADDLESAREEGYGYEAPAQGLVELADSAKPEAPAAGAAGSARRSAMFKSAPPPPRANFDEAVAGIAQRAQKNKEKIRIEGYARAGDKDRAAESLKRANVMRDKLVANGVPVDQIEVVGTGQMAQKEAVRVLAVQGEAKAEQPPPSPDASGGDEPLGQAFFLGGTPLTIEKGKSALVSMLSSEVKAERVYYYDPISSRGSQKFAFRAVMVDNPSPHTLDAGPFTVYADGQFLGEGMSDPIPGHSRAFIPFALDKKLVVENELGTREDIDRLLSIQRGVVTAEARRVRTTKLVLVNRGTTPALTYVRHPVTAGFTLESPPKDFEKLRGAYLFPVTVPAGASATLTIEESTPIEKSVDVRTAAGVAELALFVKTAKLSDELRQKLNQVIQMHRELGELDEKLQTIQAQVAMYRTRIDELNVQLVTLRRVPQAAELSRKLAKKMDEISDRLQHSTLEAAGVEGERLTRRVALEDRLAELTLESRRDAVAGR